MRQLGVDAQLPIRRRHTRIAHEEKKLGRQLSLTVHVDGRYQQWSQNTVPRGKRAVDVGFAKKDRIWDMAF
jgi:hypothetical protein